MCDEVDREYQVMKLIVTSVDFTVAWFTFDTVSYPPETRLTADGLTVTTDSYEPRVLLGSVGFSRGVHYWEFTIERYDGTADPAFGIARRDISREMMLGKKHRQLFNRVELFEPCSVSVTDSTFLFFLSLCSLFFKRKVDF